MSEATATVETPQPDRRPERGYWGEALHQLLHDWTAMVGLIIVVGLVVCAVFAPLIAPYDPNFQHRLGLSEVGEPLGPGRDFKLGTDALGRDELSRLAYGARVSLAVGIGAGLLASLIGLVVGGVAGVAGGWVQTLLMRAMDVVLSFPILLLAIALLAVTEPRLSTILLIIGISFGPILPGSSSTGSQSQRARVRARGENGWSRQRSDPLAPHSSSRHAERDRVRNTERGNGDPARSRALVRWNRIQPPDASWGNIVSEGQTYLLSAPWLVAFAGGAVVLAMIGFSLLGDGLRDALDPTLERRSTRLLIGGVGSDVARYVLRRVLWTIVVFVGDPHPDVRRDLSIPDRSGSLVCGAAGIGRGDRVRARGLRSR